MQYQKLLAFGAGAAVFSVGAVAFALTPSDYTLLDGAASSTLGNNSSGSVQLVSNATTTDSVINYALGTPTLTLADLTNLSTDAMFTAGSCGGGSPRFQINLQTASGTKNVFAYVGAPPNYTGCAEGSWTNTGNLIASSSTVDASQIGGGSYEPWSQVVADYGTDQVTGIQLVADGGWAFPSTGQTVNVDNTQINGALYTYESATSTTGTTTPPVTGTTTPPTTKNECKDGGWLGLMDLSGHSFKNQGDCVSYVATGGKNEGAGQVIATTSSPTTTPISSFLIRAERDFQSANVNDGNGNGKENGQNGNGSGNSQGHK